jgi:ribosomal protein L11 methyltransferase
MRQVSLTVRRDALEAVLDRLLPILPQGVHEWPPDGTAIELVAYGPGPPLAELEAAAGDALLGSSEGEAPDDPAERRRLALASRPPVSGLVVRPSGSPAPPAGVLDVIIDAPGGAFGAGAHPTTAMCLELLMALEPRGAFADLGCGTGVLGITAALRGWDPVIAIDHEVSGVEAARANAGRNGVELDLVVADLLELDPPPAPTVAANVPPAVHAHLAARLPADVRRLIVSGIVEDALDGVIASYAGLRAEHVMVDGGWAAALLVRDG